MAILFLVIAGVAVLFWLGGVQAQQISPPAVGTAPTSAAPIAQPPQLTPGLLPEPPRTRDVKPPPLLVPEPPIALPVPAPPRFQFNIDPKTPLSDLLPEVPQHERKNGPRFPNELSQVPEVAFGRPLPKEVVGQKAMEKTAHQIAKINHLNQRKSDAFMEALLHSRPDLKGLPFAMGEACRTKGERTEQFNLALITVRRALQTIGGGKVKQIEGAAVPNEDGKDRNEVVEKDVVVRSLEVLGQGNFWDDYLSICATEDKTNANHSREQREHVTLARIAALVQILGPESQEMRLGLVKYLAGVSHPEATRQLARLALFATEAEVRSNAAEALKIRRERDYTDMLLQGLRYPWPAVARHASEAIIKLERNDLLPQLVAVLDEPDPRLPVNREVDGRKVPEVRELVRLNHHRNCLMCHAPGNTPSISAEAVTAQVPIPSEPLPNPSNGYQNSVPDLLVRVDVTYLRQDFSLKLPVADAAPWPEMQRFDFVVRTRTLNEDEAQAFRAEFGQQDPHAPSPYHRAALQALRELTGRDAAPTAAAWRELLRLRRSDS